MGGAQRSVCWQDRLRLWSVIYSGMKEKARLNLRTLGPYVQAETTNMGISKEGIDNTDH